MAATGIDRLQLSHRRAIQRRYDEDQRRMAMAIALLLYQFGRNGMVSRDTLARMTIKAAIWAQVLRPYYIGAGTEPFNGSVPQSPFATLVRDGVEGAMRIQVKRSIALLKRYIKDEVILRWFLSPMPFGRIELPPVKQENYQQPFYAYVDPNGYKLNDRILRNAVDARAKLDRMIDYHIARGTDTMAMGGAITNFMTISGRSTDLPYGDYGSYAPWRMLRSEMQVANGRATVIAGILNPVVDRIWWRVSPGHTEPDPCDINASGGVNGDGIYPIDNYPRYPNHPGEACSLIPVAAENMDEIRQHIGDHIRNNSPTARFWRGTMNEDSLVRSLMTEDARALPQLTGAARDEVLRVRGNVH